MTEQQLQEIARLVQATREVVRDQGERLDSLAQRVRTLEGLFNALYDKVIAPDGTNRVKALEGQVAALKGQLAQPLAGPGPIDRETYE